MNPFLSFIVPVYNMEKYLGKCLDSLLNQSFSNVEIILVNDGSTDSSSSICDSYASTDKRVTVIHKGNAGLGFARNSGLDIAKGEFISFIDSDDWVGADLAKRVYDLISGRNFDYIEFGLIQTNEQGTRTGMVLPKIPAGEYGREKIVKDVLPDFLRDSGPRFSNSACNHIYSSELLRKTGLRFHNEREIYAEDFLFNLGYLVHVQNAYVTDEIFYFYRINEGSLTRSFRENYLEAVCRRDDIVRCLLSDNRLDYLAGNVTEKFVRISPVFVFNAMLLRRTGGRRAAINEIRRVLEHSSFRQAIESFGLGIFPLKLRPVYWLMKKNMPLTLFLILYIISNLPVSSRYRS